MKVVMLGVDLDEELAQRVRDEEAPKRVTRIPGIGVLTATALVAAAGIIMHKHSLVVAIWQLGWVWYRVRRRQGENRGCCAPVSAAMAWPPLKLVSPCPSVG